MLWMMLKICNNYCSSSWIEKLEGMKTWICSWCLTQNMTLLTLLMFEWKMWVYHLAFLCCQTHPNILRILLGIPIFHRSYWSIAYWKCSYIPWKLSSVTKQNLVWHNNFSSLDVVGFPIQKWISTKSRRITSIQPTVPCKCNEKKIVFVSNITQKTVLCRAQMHQRGEPSTFLCHLKKTSKYVTQATGPSCSKIRLK